MKKLKPSPKGKCFDFLSVLPTNSLRKVWRPVSRICTRIVECMHVHSDVCLVSSVVGVTDENCHKPLEGQVVLTPFETLLNLEKREKLMII